MLRKYSAYLLEIFYSFNLSFNIFKISNSYFIVGTSADLTLVSGFLCLNLVVSLNFLPHSLPFQPVLLAAVANI